MSTNYPRLHHWWRRDARHSSCEDWRCKQLKNMICLLILFRSLLLFPYGSVLNFLGGREVLAAIRAAKWLVPERWRGGGKSHAFRCSVSNVGMDNFHVIHLPFVYFVYEIYETQDPSSSFGALHSKISLAKPATRSLSNRYSASSHNPIPNPGYFNRSWCDVHGRLLSPSCYQKWLNLRKSWGVEDFYMVSQTYVVGTARPTLYTVFLDAKLRKLGIFRIWNFKHRCKS